MEYFADSSSVQVGLVVCNKPGAGVARVAADHDIPVVMIRRDDFFHSRSVLEVLAQYGTDWLILAGFLWLVPPYLVHAFPRRIINIHPALLPAFGGKGMYGHFVHEAVKAAGVSETGITIHYVNEEYDAGDMILQVACPVMPDDTPETIAQKVQKMEHLYFPQVIAQLTTGYSV